MKLAEKMLDNCSDKALFSVGKRVSHNIFGVGTIEALDMDKQAYLIKFDELKTARKISFKIELTEFNEAE